jgi:hypothetical protein
VDEIHPWETTSPQGSKFAWCIRKLDCFYMHMYVVKEHFFKKIHFLTMQTIYLQRWLVITGLVPDVTDVKTI